jgi:hypothetical protein
MNNIYWPDGVKRQEPCDGFSYWVGTDLWMYDKSKSQWFRINTVKSFKSEEAIETSNPLDLSLNKCECGSEAVGSNRHSHRCPKAGMLDA